jgi:ATP-dependent DNA helicase UvrD/PcrA
MIRLNEEQKAVVARPGNVIVNACPGSGKTRVLTARVIRGLEELTSNKHRVIALTFTNRATDEIRSRLDKLSISGEQLWAGTIHSFALEWILRPYASYCPRLQRGFSVADEFFSERILSELKEEYGVDQNVVVNTVRDRTGCVFHEDETAEEIFETYDERLRDSKLLDYNGVLYYSYALLQDIPEIAETLASIIRLICVDEIQDTQDLQFGILSAMFGLPTGPPTIFFVGDSDQSIYESLGAVTRTADEIAEEFRLDIEPLSLTGNYRSTQRIIDFYQRFRPGPRIESLTDYATDQGEITFYDQTVPKEALPAVITRLIRESLGSGVQQREICVLAPHWWQVRALGRSLVRLMPDVDFDAPGLSPFHSQRENFWFKIARLFLTTPSPSLYRTRLRWAGEVLHDLRQVYCIAVAEVFQKPRSLLRLVNSIKSDANDGLEFLDDVFDGLATALSLDLGTNNTLGASRDLFFGKARYGIEKIGDGAPTDVVSFKKLFKHPYGVVISTCHAVKGEEYNTVIAFGLLKGYVPHWNVIYADAATAKDRESKLLYVICSRAKKRLHLIAESGRLTKRRNRLETATLLRSLEFTYDGE